MTNSSVLRIREFSDSHLGHNKTPTSHLIHVLSTMIPDNEITGELDLIIIAGDFFDRDLQLYQDEVYEIQLWISAFLRMCKKRNIIVRYVEGTPRHDWKQPKLFVQLNEMLNIGADVKYFDTVDIEYIPLLDINILYIPDEFKTTTQETQMVVMDVMRAKNLTTVDFVAMHGAFPHQLPKASHAKAQLHDPDFFLRITKYFIFVGHIHQYSQYDRILAAGSTDRYSHNDEKPKGMIDVVVNRDTDLHDIRFIENKQASVFKTVNAVGLDEEASMDLLRKTIRRYGVKFHLQVEAKVNDAIHRIIDKFLLTYKEIDWKFKRIEDKRQEPISNIAELFKHVSLNKENIIDVLLQRVEMQYPEHLEKSKQILKAVIDE